MYGCEGSRTLIRSFYIRNGLAAVTGEQSLVADARYVAGQGNAEYGRGIARALAGAVIFSFPLLMTMEMWWLGFYLDRPRLFLFLALTLLLLIPLNYFVGFERTVSLFEDVMDAFVAFGIGAVSSAALLTLFGVLTPRMDVGEVAGMIAIQTVPASIGAVVARGQMGGGENETEEKKKRSGFAGQLFIMVAGAIFLAFNVAPTEEMILIAFKMTPWHALALIVLSIAVLHAFVYALDFRGEEKLPEGMGFAAGLVTFSIAGYAIALVISLYVLWTFGRTDGASLDQIAMMTIVLGFPSALGAASARLLI